MKKSDVRFKMGGGKTLLLGFALLVIALVVISCEQPDNNVDADDGTWKIYTAEDLLAWNEYVTNTEHYDEIPNNPSSYMKYYEVKTNATLMADITLPDPEEGQTSNWTPVGYYDRGIEYYYAGTFDGGGHTISNLKINSSDSNNLGLFGYIATDGAVKNLTLSDVDISGFEYIGGIAGRNYGTIENSSVSGSVSGATLVGGIVGYNEGKGIISDCKTMGKVSGTTLVGGIAGSNEGEISGCTNSAQVSAESNGLTYAGGITGLNSGNISTSCNEKKGTIVTLGGDRAYSGGIAGYNEDAIANKNGGNITETCNKGQVYATCVEKANTLELYKGGFAGGIVGYCEVGTIAASHNEAEVYAKCMLSGDYMVCAGGVIGFTQYNSSFIACYNSGEFSGESSERPIYLGGIVGYLGPGTTTACYNTGTGKVVGGNLVYNGGITGYIDSGTLQSNYWEKGTEGTPDSGIGFNVSNDNATEVDGSEGNTWADALSRMNEALSGYGYEYKKNTDTEANKTVPLVIEKKSSN